MAYAKNSPKGKGKLFHCSKCTFKSKGPTDLGSHYKLHPSHRKVAKLTQVAVKKAPKKKTKTKVAGWHYCPNCGQELQ